MKNLLLIKWAAIAVLLLLVIFTITMIFYWRAEPTLIRKQLAFEKAIDSKKIKPFNKLIAKSYSDRWGYKAEDIGLTALDIRTQYIYLTLKPREAKWTIEGSKATLSVKYSLEGQPKTPIAKIITQRSNQLQTPMLFSWEKQSFWPWSWRLTELDNQTIPDDAWDYTPGDLKRASENIGNYLP